MVCVIPREGINHVEPLRGSTPPAINGCGLRPVNIVGSAEPLKGFMWSIGRALRNSLSAVSTPLPDRERRPSAARGGEGPTANGLKFLLLQGQCIRTTCDNGGRRLKHAARGIAHATYAPRARLTMTLTLILSLKWRGVTQRSPPGRTASLGLTPPIIIQMLHD
jgi:hypothetical protein